MLQAFVDSPSSTGPLSPDVKLGPKSAQQQRATPGNRKQRVGAPKGPGGECDLVMERISKNPRAAAAFFCKHRPSLLRYYMLVPRQWKILRKTKTISNAVSRENRVETIP